MFEIVGEHTREGRRIEEEDVHGVVVNQWAKLFVRSCTRAREYTHKIAGARPWLDIWQCSNKWQRERRVQALWPRIRRPLSGLTRDIMLVPFAKIGLIVSLRCLRVVAFFFLCLSFVDEGADAF